MEMDTWANDHVMPDEFEAESNNILEGASRVLQPQTHTPAIPGQLATETDQLFEDALEALQSHAVPEGLELENFLADMSEEDLEALQALVQPLPRNLDILQQTLELVSIIYENIPEYTKNANKW
jgi:hypothetical protein